MDSKEQEQQIRRLTAWNNFWIGLWVALLLLGLFAVVGTRLLNDMNENRTTLRMRRNADGGLKLYASSDGPFVVTHIAAYGKSASDLANAALPEPIAITDSAGASIAPGTLKTLTWRSALTGKKVPFPARADLKALYYRPLAAEAAKP